MLDAIADALVHSLIAGCIAAALVLTWKQRQPSVVFGLLLIAMTLAVVVVVGCWAVVFGVI